MNTKHVTSLALSKRLKELGIKQDSEFYWNSEGKLEERYFRGLDNSEHYQLSGGYSAFLASELGEMLPHEVAGHRLQVWHEKEDTWDIAYNTDSGNLEPMPWEQSRTLPEAIGLMLVYLKENKLI